VPIGELKHRLPAKLLPLVEVNRPGFSGELVT
jgi:hypothetical protein